MELALALATLFNTTAPGIAQIILMVQQQDGSVSIIPILNAADKKFDANIASAQSWLAAHKVVGA